MITVTITYTVDDEHASPPDLYWRNTVIQEAQRVVENSECGLVNPQVSITIDGTQLVD